jgi:hypothetical protein
MPVEPANSAGDDTLLHTRFYRYSITVTEKYSALGIALNQPRVKNRACERGSITPDAAHRRLQPFGRLGGFSKAAGHDAEFIAEHFVVVGRAVIADATCWHCD